MMDRGQLIDHVRTVAAAEVGLSLGHFDGITTAPAPAARTAPGAATDAALRQLVSLCCDAVIRRDADAFAALWTDDGQWDAGAPEPVSGHDQIRAAFDKAVRPLAWIVQTPGACVFEVDETTGTASGRVTFDERFQRRRGAGGTLLATYHDDYRREGGHWRFVRRRLEVIDRR
jgi:ketosteroid isomerase-like protein